MWPNYHHNNLTHTPGPVVDLPIFPHYLIVKPKPNLNYLNENLTCSAIPIKVAACSFPDELFSCLNLSYDLHWVWLVLSLNLLGSTTWNLLKHLLLSSWFAPCPVSETWFSIQLKQENMSELLALSSDYHCMLLNLSGITETNPV